MKIWLYAGAWKTISRDFSNYQTIKECKKSAKIKSQTNILIYLGQEH